MQNGSQELDFIFRKASFEPPQESIIMRPSVDRVMGLLMRSSPLILTRFLPSMGIFGLEIQMGVTSISLLD